MPVIAPSKPTAPTRPRKAEQRDYPTIALCSWLDFQLAKCDIDVILARLHTYHWRLSRAAWWFDTHDRDDPQHAEATALRSQLEHDEYGDRALLQMRAVGALYHLWNCVLACDLAESPVSLADDLSDLFSVMGTTRGLERNVDALKGIVRTAWERYLPHCPIPTYMPDDHRANWVEWRLGAVPTWQLEDLQETLNHKKSGS